MKDYYVLARRVDRGSRLRATWREGAGVEVLFSVLLHRAGKRFE